jgi:hypothetical protein
MVRPSAPYTALRWRAPRDERPSPERPPACRSTWLDATSTNALSAQNSKPAERDRPRLGRSLYAPPSRGVSRSRPSPDRELACHERTSYWGCVLGSCVRIGLEPPIKSSESRGMWGMFRAPIHAKTLLEPVRFQVRQTAKTREFTDSEQPAGARWGSGGRGFKSRRPDTTRDVMTTYGATARRKSFS